MPHISNTSWAQFLLGSGLVYREKDVILLSHGDGGLLTRRLIDDVFRPHFTGEALRLQSDSAVLSNRPGKLAFTTDAFVIDPLFFPGGNIGKLAVCGTVNDLAVSGAVPAYISASFIIEEGLEIEVLDKVAASMARECRTAGVEIVAGDTKVVERGHLDKLYITTTGIGWLPNGLELGYHRIQSGDLVVVNGNLGDHGMSVIASRYSLNMNYEIMSDCASLNGIIGGLLKRCTGVRMMRDLTRGGFVTAAKEIALSSGKEIWLEEECIPISAAVKEAADVLGLDPLYLANEGKFLAIIDPSEKEVALQFLKGHPLGESAAVVGQVKQWGKNVYLKTALGGTRVLDLLAGAPMPRIC